MWPLAHGTGTLHRVALWLRSSSSCQRKHRRIGHITNALVSLHQHHLQVSLDIVIDDGLTEQAESSGLAIDCGEGHTSSPKDYIVDVGADVQEDVEGVVGAADERGARACWASRRRLWWFGLEADCPPQPLIRLHPTEQRSIRRDYYM